MKRELAYPLLVAEVLIAIFEFKESIVGQLNTAPGRLRQSKEDNFQETSGRHGKTIERKETYSEVLKRQHQGKRGTKRRCIGFDPPGA